MKGIKVEYTVKQDFAETNKANIQNVVKDLKSKNPNGVMYSSWTKADGKSFVHLFLSAEGVPNPLSEMESFRHFQAELKKNVEVPPQVIELQLVGASFALR